MTDAISESHYDVVIATLGFEDRCFAALDALAAANVTVEHLVVTEYSTNPDDNNKNRERFQELAEHLCDEPTWLQSDDVQFSAELRERLSGWIAPEAGSTRLAWDISVAANRLIMQVTAVLLDLACDLTVLYAEAAEYFPTESEYRASAAHAERDLIESGTLAVDVAASYAGDHSSHLPNHLVVFPGYSRDRVRRVIAKVDPDLLDNLVEAPITWLIGSPHAAPNAWRRDAVIEIQGLSGCPDVVEVSTFSLLDTLTTLERVCEPRRLSANLTLCPMGSKLQTLGCALFCHANPEVRVMLAVPAVYMAGHYTKGVEELWALDFGASDQLCEGLASVGTLRRRVG
jgi:hypothetical protein